MRIPSHHFESSGRRDATMTPMIDVVFLLLIFFICTASFQIIEHNLPSPIQMETPGGVRDLKSEPAEQDLEPVVLKIGWQRGAPTWTISGEPCSSWIVLQQQLAAAAAVDAAVDTTVDAGSYRVSGASGFNNGSYIAARASKVSIKSGFWRKSPRRSS